MTAKSFVVVDSENGVAVGTFATKEEATTYFTRLAQAEEWGDVCKLIDETGSPFLSDAWPDYSGLVLYEVLAPIADPYLVEPYEPPTRAEEV
jgi:hypothetical protein